MLAPAFATVTHIQKKKGGDAHVAAEWLTPDDKPQQADTRRSSVCCPGRQSGFKVGLVAPRRAPLPKRWQLRVTKWTKSGCLPMTGCLMATTPISSKAYGVIVVHTLSSGEGRRPEGLIRLTNHNLFLVGRDSRYGVPKYSRIHKDSQQRAQHMQHSMQRDYRLSASILCQCVQRKRQPISTYQSACTPHHVKGHAFFSVYFFGQHSTRKVRTHGRAYFVF